MTTIAWDGKALAGDRRLMFGHMIAEGSEEVKLARAGGGRFIYGLAGNYVAGEGAVHDWIAGGMLRGWGGLSGDWGAIVLDMELGEVWYAQDGANARSRIGAPFAIGSGADYAMGAMLAGATAAEAVAIAAKLDPGTGGKVDRIATSFGAKADA